MRFKQIQINKCGPFDSIQITFPEKTLADEAEVHILTGVNGTGKSTVLRCFQSFVENRSESLYKRFKGVPGQDYKDIGGFYLFNFFTFDHDYLGHQKIYFNKNNVAQIISGRQLGGPDSNLLAEVYDHYHQTYSNLLKSSRVNFAAFGYAGGRTLNSTGLTSITEVLEGPLQKALSFENTNDPKILVQWIASIKTKEAMAFRKGLTERVTKHQSAIQRIENAISDIIEAPITFDFEDEPALQVKVILNHKSIDFDVLPDGLKSIMSWLADLLMRLERIPWENEFTNVLFQPFSLFLDEVDVHLHPKWQRKILYIVKKLFPNAQIIVATHSPFVVSSIEGGWIHQFKLLPDGRSIPMPAVPSKAGYSYESIVDDIFGISEDFDLETEKDIKRFRTLKDKIISGKENSRIEFDSLTFKLQKKSPELSELIAMELRQLKRVLSEK